MVSLEKIGRPKNLQLPILGTHFLNPGETLMGIINISKGERGSTVVTAVCISPSQQNLDFSPSPRLERVFWRRPLLRFPGGPPGDRPNQTAADVVARFHPPESPRMSIAELMNMIFNPFVGIGTSTRPKYRNRTQKFKYPIISFKS